MQIYLQIVRKCQWRYTQLWGKQRKKRVTVCELTPLHFKKRSRCISSEIRSYLKAQFAYSGW